MEVHHHPIASGSHTERKRWTHYLWEFFMLFMAVTLGFFVENQREQIVERHRGSQYIRSFVDDLIKDTAGFSYLINVYQQKASTIDNIFTCYDSVTGKLRSYDCLVNIAQHTTGFPDFVYTDRTLQQLKNAGGLRLLNHDDADSISSYDNELRAQEKNETTEVQETQTLIRSLTYELVNFPAMRAIVINKNRTTTEENKIPFLYGKNSDLINKYFNALFHYGRLMHSQIFYLKRLLGKANSLITYLKKKHHIT